ncbi:MAG: radical SAM protein [Candidatus Micrarchaeia archaeon]
MTHVVFVQNYLWEALGPEYISAVLKTSGHKCSMVLTKNEKNWIERVQYLNPDIVAISTTTPHWKSYKLIIKEIKDRIGVPVVVGGPHPTFYPKILEDPNVDMICIGEGEYAMRDVADALERNSGIENIPNIHIKHNGRIYRNEVRPLIENLDELPVPDRELYYGRYRILRDIPVKRFLTSRGCPYRCTYCFNHAYRRIYAGKGKYVRRRSPENVIEEIEEVRREYPFKIVRFPDDTMTLDHEWLEKFIRLYKDRIGLPFTCLGRPNEINESVVKLLKEGGCNLLCIGVESGSERVRNEIMKRGISDEQIFACGRLLKKYGIKFLTYNIFGTPTETLEEAYKTIDMNIKLGVDYTSCSVLQPFPGTDIYEIAVRGNALDPEYDADCIDFYGGRTRIKQENIDRITNLAVFLYPVVKFPFIFPIVKLLIRLPPNPLFKMMYYLNNGIPRIMSLCLDPYEAIILALNFWDQL